MCLNGFIILDRKILDWGWISDEKVFKTFLTCILMANFRDNTFEGTNIPRGSFVTSYANLADRCRLSVQSLRTCLKKLVKTGEINIQTTNKFTLISVNNYDKYQQQNEEINKQITNNQQTTNNQLTTTEQCKQGKQCKQYIGEKKTKVFTPPSLDEVKAYCLERGKGINANYWYDFYQSKDWYIGKNKMKDWKAAVRTWEKNSMAVSQPKPTNPYNNAIKWS